MTLSETERLHEPTHSERVSTTAHDVARNIENHSYSQVYKHLNELRTYDTSHHQNFKTDLTDINHQLHQEFHKDKFPSMTIDENGKGGFTVKEDKPGAAPKGSTAAPRESGNATTGGGTGSDVSSTGATPTWASGSPIGSAGVPASAANPEVPMPNMPTTGLSPLTGNSQSLVQVLESQKGDSPQQAQQAAQVAQALIKFLTSQGMSKAAADGIVGNMAQESVLNPESVGSGGGGLIGWTPLPGGLVTGNVSADLASQEKALMQYINQNGSVADINAHASSATAAASYFMSKYERPAVATENAAFREQAAQAASALG